MEAGRYELKENRFAHRVVENVSPMVADRAAPSRHYGSHGAGLPRIWADERAVRQVTLNLLSNAIKFTPQGGSITIKVG